MVADAEVAVIVDAELTWTMATYMAATMEPDVAF